MSLEASGRCPKCGRARADAALACPRCGLTFALWNAERGGADAGLDATGEALWNGLPAAWKDPAAHEAFIKHCAQTGRLAAAGRSYRAYLDTHPGDATATQMQTRIVGMATAAFLPAQATRAPVVRSNWFLWVIAVGALLGILAGLFFQTLSS
ncbi:MAG TPA: hypothetical protein VGF45_12145 [Polyangia bacterium]